MRTKATGDPNIERLAALASSGRKEAIARRVKASRWYRMEVDAKASKDDLDAALDAYDAASSDVEEADRIIALLHGRGPRDPEEYGRWLAKLEYDIHKLISPETA